MALLTDGLGTTIAFQFAPTAGGVVFFERSIKPFGFDGRGGINVTSLRNQLVVTKISKQLADVTDMTGTVLWDPEMYNVIWDNLLQYNQEILLGMPNGEVFSFYGWLDKFDPQEHQEGELPLANITIIASNLDEFGFEAEPIQLF